MNRPTSLTTLIRAATCGTDLSPLRPGFFFCGPAVVVAYFIHPRPDQAAAEGDFGNGNTAEGSGTFLNLSTSTDNTGNGANTLLNNTTAIGNTTTGSAALTNNTTGGFNTASARMVAKQQCIILQQERQIEALAKRVDKVSAQAEMSRPEPQLAATIE